MIEKGLTHDGNNKKTGRPEFLCGEKSSTQFDVLFGDSPAGKLWGFMWEARDFDGPIKWFVEGAGVTRPTLMKVFPDFLDQDWIICSRVVRGIQYYKINVNHFIVKDMLLLMSKFIHANTEMLMAKEDVKDKLALKYKKKKPRKKKVVKKND